MPDDYVQYEICPPPPKSKRGKLKVWIENRDGDPTVCASGEDGLTVRICYLRPNGSLFLCNMSSCDALDRLQTNDSNEIVTF